ncbi:DUF2240 family protein [Candidatus Thorarchaeota archaeon]|nr:MAG: DUF2240 family protein [Candidatus Thorarchaeota archaeon]
MGYSNIAISKITTTSKRLLDENENMNGRDMLLILAHLFRKKGGQVSIEDSVHFLSFNCRYGVPTDVRKLLTSALNNELISRDGDTIKAEFLFDKQFLPLNLSAAFEDKVRFNETIQPLR